jgi:hypothetical protein
MPGRYVVSGVTATRLSGRLPVSVPGAVICFSIPETYSPGTGRIGLQAHRPALQAPGYCAECHHWREFDVLWKTPEGVSGYHPKVREELGCLGRLMFDWKRALTHQLERPCPLGSELSLFYDQTSHDAPCSAGTAIFQPHRKRILTKLHGLGARGFARSSV